MLACASIVVGLLALLGAFVAQPWYFPPEATPEFRLVGATPTLDAYLGKFQGAIGKDYERYRNHCLRVLSFATYFMEKDHGWSAAEMAPAMPVMEAALAYHDLALWTDDTLDYLGPSAERAEADLKEAFAEDKVQLIKQMIEQHHKLTAWEGENQELVNAVRKGDWVDASLGLVRNGMPAGNIAKANEAFPNLGFHDMLAAFGARLHPEDIRRRLEILRIFKL